MEDLIMLINFEPSYWCLFSVSPEFFCIEVSALKNEKCGEDYANRDHDISDDQNFLVHAQYYSAFLHWQLFEIGYLFLP